MTIMTVLLIFPFSVAAFSIYKMTRRLSNIRSESDADFLRRLIWISPVGYASAIYLVLAYWMK